jgi:hypothetical protein
MKNKVISSSNNQNQIAHIFSLYSMMKYRDCHEEFYNFVSVYGKKKIMSILKAKGVQDYGISPSVQKNVPYLLSCKVADSATKQKYQYAKLYSNYCISRYSATDELNILDENKKQIMFDCLVKNKSVDTKKKFSLMEIKKLVDSGKIILLAVKEKPLLECSVLSQDLQSVSDEHISNFENKYLFNRLFPILQYADKPEILNNLAFYSKQMPKISKEINKANRAVLKTVLEYELQMEQIALSAQFEKEQREMMKSIENYQNNAGKLSKLLNLNQVLLEKLSAGKHEVEGKEDFFNF